MKKSKFILFLASFMMLFATAFNANAQEFAVKNSKFFDNTFIGIEGGGSFTNHIHGDNLHFNNGIFGVKVGKYITHITAFQLSYQVGFTNEELLKNAIDDGYLKANVLFNLNNMFVGYKGERRRFETFLIGGIGWHHIYGADKLERVSDFDDNKLAANVGLQLDTKLNDAFTLNLTPSYSYMFDAEPMGKHYFQATIGLTYHFKNSHGKRHFVLAELKNNEEWEALNNNINDLRRENEQLTATASENSKQMSQMMQTIEQLSECCNKVKALENKKVELSNVVGFDINSSKVANSQLANLSNVAQALNNNKDLKVEVVGFADAETGTKEFNQTLSEKRAEAVKTLLVEKFNVDGDRISTIGRGATEQVFEENDLNRATIFVTK